MGMIRDLARRAVKRIGSLVARDDLFEKPGERPSTPPFPVKEAPAAGSKAAVAKPVAAAPAPRADVKPAAAAAPAPKVDVNPAAAAAPQKAPVAPAPAPKADAKPAATAAPEKALAAKPVAAPAPAPKADAKPAATAAAPAPAQKAEAKPAAAPAPAPKADAKPTVTASRPQEGCVPVDVAGLIAALAPAGKPLVVNHWATWCEACVDELPRLVRAAAGVADLGEFIGVSWDLFDHPGKPAQVAKKVGRFADSAGIGYASVLFTGTPRELFATCGLDFEQIPQTVVFAPDGRVVYHKKGVIDHDDVFPLIDAVKAAR